MHHELISHLCMVQARLQIIQVGLWNHELRPQSPTDVADAFVHALKVGMLALARRSQQAQQLQTNPDSRFETLISAPCCSDSQAQCLKQATTRVRVSDWVSNWLVIPRKHRCQQQDETDIG